MGTDDGCTLSATDRWTGRGDPWARLALQFTAGRKAVIYLVAALGAVALLVYLTVSLLKPEWF